MKAVAINSHGGREVLKIMELEKPEPKPGEVRVKIRATALNHLDIWVRKGFAHLKLAYPHILGADIAGEIDALGEGVTWFKVGQKTVLHPAVSCGHCYACASGNDNLCREYKILGENTPGGYAEYGCFPARNALPFPEGLSFEEASAVLLPFLTAYQMVFKKSELKRGEDVLIHAAGSGVSSAAIQMAKLVGARVITTAGSDEKLELAKKLGANEVINYRKEDFSKRVRELTGKKGVEVVIDHIGQDAWEKNINSLAWGGRLVICGATSGFSGTTNLAQLFFKQLKLIGSTMGTRADMMDILKLVEKGFLKPVVGRAMPLEEAAEAHRLLEDREVFGRVVLTP
ncbi:MAG: zinc-binding dehydrogenase [Myxococcota bacterium]